ncbi:MAG: MFS transporter [Bacteroidales bacterium]|nr:MFS transporter [Bacteroidales bacterium]
MNTIQKPNLPLKQLWALSFGFFGVQIAFALQTSNVSRIFATLGADPHTLSYFWIVPPLTGLLVQPIVGMLSDRTWTKWGRRIPYLIIGTLVTALLLIILPNSGALGLAVGTAMIFAATCLVLFGVSTDMALQPFRMLVGDMVNEKQKSLAFSIQSFLCNGGNILAYLLPIALVTWGVSNVAPVGMIPDSVKWTFYIGAALLILCVAVTVFRTKELPPAEYAKYNAIDESKVREEKVNIFELLKKVPNVFWTVGLVQFFCWAAFLYMWTYTTGAIAGSVWGTTDASSALFQSAGNWVGVLFAAQAIGGVLWAMVIPKFKDIKMAYVASLGIGAIGFILTRFIGPEVSILGMTMSGQFALLFPFFLVGFAWAGMLSIPFTLLTNALQGTSRMGTYLGLFNGTICIPQIVAAVAGGGLLLLVGGNQSNMLVISGILLILGAIAVHFIKVEKK